MKRLKEINIEEVRYHEHRDMDRRIDDIENKTKSYPVLEEVMKQVVESNKTQNSTLTRLDKTMEKVGHTMETLSNNQIKIREDLQMLKEERVINIMQFFKNNFWKIIVASFLVYQALSALGVIQT